MIDPKATVDEQVVSLLKDLHGLKIECQEYCTSQVVDSVLEIATDTAEVIEAVQGKNRRLIDENIRLRATNRAYLRVIQEFIAGRADPHLAELSRAIGIAEQQGVFIREITEKLDKAMRAEGINHKTLTDKGRRLLDLIHFYLFHEIHRSAWYLENYTGRDLRLALAGLTPTAIKEAESPPPPEHGDAP